MLKGRGCVSCANKATKTKFLYSGICSLVVCLICNGKAPLTRKQIYVMLVEL